jgi:hypothetical protein
MKSLVWKSLLMIGLVCLGVTAKATPIGIAGGITTVNLDAGTVGALVGLGLTPSAVGSASLNGLIAQFPITGGFIDAPNAQIAHDGSGLRFASVSNAVELRNFLINVDLSGPTGVITGTFVNGATTLNDVPFFQIGAGLQLTLRSEAAGALTAVFGAPDLTGAVIGTASTDPQPVPEPGTWAMTLSAIGGVAVMRYRMRR